jgi:hypothetical protein
MPSVITLCVVVLIVVAPFFQNLASWLFYLFPLDGQSGTHSNNPLPPHPLRPQDYQGPVL